MESSDNVPLVHSQGGADHRVIVGVINKFRQVVKGLTLVVFLILASMWTDFFTRDPGYIPAGFYDNLRVLTGLALVAVIIAVAVLVWTAPRKTRYATRSS